MDVARIVGSYWKHGREFICWRCDPKFAAKVKALPFDVRVPNATTVKAMRAADRGNGKRFKTAGALFKIWESEKPDSRHAIQARC